MIDGGGKLISELREVMDNFKIRTSKSVTNEMVEHVEDHRTVDKAVVVELCVQLSLERNIAARARKRMEGTFEHN